MGYKVVVVGATGNVGREMLNILAERQFPVDKIAALASRRSLGTEVSFGDKTLTTQDLDQFDFTGWDMALFAIGSDATKVYAPKAARKGFHWAKMTNPIAIQPCPEVVISLNQPGDTDRLIVAPASPASKPPTNT